MRMGFRTAITNFITLGVLVAAVLGTSASAFADLRSCLPLGPGDSRAYPVFEMKPEFIHSDAVDGTIYIKPEKQFTLMPTIENGQFLITSNLYPPSPTGSHVFMYVMNGRGDFFWVNTQAPGMKHSSLSAGAPVACAGHMLVKDGKVLFVTTSSGHYKPTETQLRAVLDSLYRKGFDLSETKMVFGGNRTTFAQGQGKVYPISALSYLFHTPESQRCAKEYLLANAETTQAADLRDLRSISKSTYESFLKDADVQGRIPLYRDALAEFFSENEAARKSASPSVKKVVEPSFCRRLVKLFKR